MPKQATIKVQVKMPGTGPGEFTPYPVRAHILVDHTFAIHHPVQVAPGTTELKQDGKEWVLTHIPTGARILHGIPTIKQAQLIVKDLTNKGIDWTFTDIRTVDIELRKRAKEVVQAIKAVYGLPVY